MKKLIYLFGLSVALLMSSCSQDEVFYSCDEEEDAFVKDNLNEIQKMTRGEWLESSQDLKIPMYRAFTVEQKQLFWKEKIEKVMDCYEWTEEEQRHFMNLYNAIAEHSDWFIEKDKMKEAELEEFEIFVYKWTEYAREVLQWSDKLIAYIVCSGEDIEVINRMPVIKSVTVISTKRLRSKSESKFGDCNCTYKGWILCPGGSCMEEPGLCDETKSGCGYFLTSPCNGYC